MNVSKLQTSPLQRYIWVIFFFLIEKGSNILLLTTKKFDGALGTNKHAIKMSNLASQLKDDKYSIGLK